jgi:transposase
VQVICRDRSGAYADGATRGAPNAIQMADRWHLMHNLSEAVHKIVNRHRRFLQQPAPQPTDKPSPPAPAPTAPPPGRRAANTRSRHAAVQELLARGMSIRAITSRLGISRGSVRKYARAPTAEQLVGPNVGGGPGKLGPFEPHLHARIDDGITDAHLLYQEILERGYRGTLRTLQRFLVQHRVTTQPAAPPKVPAARHITAGIMRPDDRLTEQDRLGLKTARARCPDLDTLTNLTQASQSRPLASAADNTSKSGSTRRPEHRSPRSAASPPVDRRRVLPRR